MSSAQALRINLETYKFTETTTFSHYNTMKKSQTNYTFSSSSAISSILSTSFGASVEIDKMRVLMPL